MICICNKIYSKCGREELSRPHFPLNCKISIDIFSSTKSSNVDEMWTREKLHSYGCEYIQHLVCTKVKLMFY